MAVLEERSEDLLKMILLLFLSLAVLLKFSFLFFLSERSVASAPQSPPTLFPLQSFEAIIPKLGAGNSRTNSNFDPTETPLVSLVPKAGSLSASRGACNKGHYHYPAKPTEEL